MAVFSPLGRAHRRRVPGGKRTTRRKAPAGAPLARNFATFHEWASHGKKAATSIPIQRCRMPTVMKSKITTHPIDMGIPYAYVVVQGAKALAQRVESFAGRRSGNWVMLLFTGILVMDEHTVLLPGRLSSRTFWRPRDRFFLGNKRWCLTAGLLPDNRVGRLSPVRD